MPTCRVSLRLTLAQISSGFLNLESWAFDGWIGVGRTDSDDGVLHLYVLNVGAESSLDLGLLWAFLGLGRNGNQTRG